MNLQHPCMSVFKNASQRIRSDFMRGTSVFLLFPMDLWFDQETLHNKAHHTCSQTRGNIHLRSQGTYNNHRDLPVLGVRHNNITPKHDSMRRCSSKFLLATPDLSCIGDTVHNVSTSNGTCTRRLIMLKLMC